MRSDSPNLFCLKKFYRTAISKNLDVDLAPALVVIDEAHHALAKTYQMLWTAWPEAKFLGLTATPYRMSGDGFTDLFEVLVA